MVREKSGLSKKEFGDSLALSSSMNSQIATGRLKLPRETLGLLSSLYRVNLGWFLTGQGHFGMEEEPESEYAQIELYDQETAAGQGREIGEYIEKRYIPVMHDILRPHNPANLKAVYVSGDSMTGENINDGDIAIFNTKQTEGNGIYVVSIGSTLVVKRLDFNHLNKTIVLISANPAYEPRCFSGVDLEGIRIEGRVVACYHRM